MESHDVVRLLQELASLGIEVHVDGGWGVDALLGEQTRPHSDLDIAVKHSDVPGLRAFLETNGFEDVPRDDTRECNFVLGDDRGREIDIHSYEFDEGGRIVFGIDYPIDSLQGYGTIGGYPVKCITAEWMVRFHTGYQVDENDYRDVLALHARFGIPLPEEYSKFLGFA